MLSNNIKLINLKNIKIKKNNFEKICIYDCLNKFKDKFTISYSNYKPELDKIIYSYREVLPKNHKWPTDYSKEMTYICDIKDDKLINNKSLFKINNISHNYSITKIDNNYIGIGGVYGISTKHNCKNQNGIFYILKNNINDLILPLSKNKFNILINKNLTFKQNFIKCFDSNISIIKFNNNYLLYVRHNEGSGKRNTQIFISKYIDKNYTKFNIVKFDKKLYTYCQFLFVENNIIIGIYRVYNSILNNSHRLYNKNPRIILTYSYDMVNFKILYTISEDYYDFITNNYKKEGNYNIFYTNNIKNNIFTKYKIRSGGYINYEQDNIKEESEIKLEILNNINKILINYTIKKDGYIKLYFNDNNNELKEEKQLEGDCTDFNINIKKNYKYIKILLFNSFIYQIL